VPTAEPVHTTEWFLGSEPTRRTPASAIHTEPPETQLPPTVPKGPLSQEAGPSASWPWSASCYCPCWTPGSPTSTSGCRDQLREAFAAEGPALIEAVVNPDELPLTPVIKTQHAQNLAWGLARGEPNRDRIALTMSRVMARELTSSASPAGVVERTKEKLEDVTGRTDGKEKR
jgi:hypothetical protein